MPQHASESARSTDGTVLIDPISTVDEYLDRSDWRVNANANQGYSVGGLILNAPARRSRTIGCRRCTAKKERSPHTRNGD